MKIKPGFSLKQEGNRFFIFSTENPQKEPLAVNDMVALLFEQLSNGVDSKEQLLNAMLDRFDISVVLALSQIDLCMKEFRENGMLES